MTLKLTQGRLSQVTTENVLEPLLDALNDKVAKIRKLAVLALSKVSSRFIMSKVGQNHIYGARYCLVFVLVLVLFAYKRLYTAYIQSSGQLYL